MSDYENKTESSVTAARRSLTDELDSILELLSEEEKLQAGDTISEVITTMKTMDKLKTAINGLKEVASDLKEQGFTEESTVVSTAVLVTQEVTLTEVHRVVAVIKEIQAERKQ